MDKTFNLPTRFQEAVLRVLRSAQAPMRAGQINGELKSVFNLELKKPSVFQALNRLAADDLIMFEKRDFKKGEQIFKDTKFYSASPKGDEALQKIEEFNLKLP